MTRVWSDQQKEIFTWSRNERRIVSHLVVFARAGTGKTTTILEAINHAPEKSILLCAFNKRIAEELTARLTNPAAEAKTLHSVGFAAVRRYWQGLGIAKGSERSDALALQVCGSIAPEPVIKLVSKLHTKGREIAPHARTFGELTDLAINFECEPDEHFTWCKTCGRPRDEHDGVDHNYDGYDLQYIEDKALEAMEIAATVKPVQTGIDFSDMIFLPVRNRWLVKTYDLVVVDEAQDMTMAQLEIAQGVCRGRICIVGDDRQAIYGFRGADSGSLQRLLHQLQAEVCGLTTTYRCGKKIVEEAQRIVPDFFAGEDNPDGEIASVTYDKLPESIQHGDFLLSRLNAPLLSVAISLLRNGKRARIAGRDIGKGLQALVRKLAKQNSIPKFMERVEAWEEKEIVRLVKAKREDRIDGVKDQADMLRELAQSSTSVQEMLNKIDVLFTDDGLGQAGIVTCSSIHKAKGLESNRVFILEDTLRASRSKSGDAGRNREEDNLKYVAITRAKTHLFWVRKPAA